MNKNRWQLPVHIKTLPPSSASVWYKLLLCLTPSCLYFDVELQNYYLKRRHLAIFCISLLWQRGTRQEKRADHYLKKNHLAVFCIDRTAIGCYDFVRVLICMPSWLSFYSIFFLAIWIYRTIPISGKSIHWCLALHWQIQLGRGSVFDSQQRDSRSL